MKMATLLFDDAFDDRNQYEASASGFLSHVFVQLGDRETYSVVFYSHVRLGQDLEEEVKLGNGFVADPGMIVLDEVTLVKMQKAIDRLAMGKFFQSLVPVERPHK
jgi:hypothetical protein